MSSRAVCASHGQLVCIADLLMHLQAVWLLQAPVQVPEGSKGVVYSPSAAAGATSAQHEATRQPSTPEGAAGCGSPLQAATSVSLRALLPSSSPPANHSPDVFSDLEEPTDGRGFSGFNRAPLQLQPLSSSPPLAAATAADPTADSVAGISLASVCGGSRGSPVARGVPLRSASTARSARLLRLALAQRPPWLGSSPCGTRSSASASACGENVVPAGRSAHAGSGAAGIAAGRLRERQPAAAADADGLQARVCQSGASLEGTAAQTLQPPAANHQHTSPPFASGAVDPATCTGTPHSSPVPSSVTADIGDCCNPLSSTPGSSSVNQPTRRRSPWGPMPGCGGGSGAPPHNRRALSALPLSRGNATDLLQDTSPPLPAVAAQLRSHYALGASISSGGQQATTESFTIYVDADATGSLDGSDSRGATSSSGSGSGCRGGGSGASRRLSFSFGRPAPACGSDSKVYVPFITDLYAPVGVPAELLLLFLLAFCSAVTAARGAGNLCGIKMERHTACLAKHR
jgi:hypothetical protein